VDNERPLADNRSHKDARVSGFWSAFCRAASVPEATPYQAWYFGDSPALAHELVELVLNGPQTRDCVLGGDR